VLTKSFAGFKGFILPVNNFIQSSTSEESTGVHQNAQQSSTVGSSFIVFGRKEKYSDFSFGDKDAYSDYTTIANPRQGGMVPDKTSRSVSVLGDINGDSFPDLLIGDPLTSTCFVYLGQERNRFMNLPLSFIITNTAEESNDFFGWATAAVSDMNNDGKDEFMISAIYSNTVYVVYGRNNFPNNLVVSQTASFTKGFKIKGSTTDINFGMSISSAGDFNNDGWKDYLISSMSVSTSLSFQSVIYIIFGNSSSTSSSNNPDIVIDQLPNYCYLKVIAPRSSFAGFSLSSLGDINQDGFDDIIIGSIPYQGGYSSQKSYVLYGKSSLLDKTVLLLSEMKSGEEGFTITGGGFAVAGPGDVNEDGVNDILIVNYNQWQGKENSYLLFYPAIGNITSPPTFLPSSLPSNYPSSSPSSRPSASLIIDSPTNRPSSSVPTVHRVTETFPPALSMTLSPTKAPQTNKPSRNPTMKPSTRFPTTGNPITTIPTITITARPSFRPSVSPTLVPSRLPTSVTVRPSADRPSRFPTSFPSSSPTESVSTPFTTVTITNNGSFVISSINEEVEVSGNGRGRKKEIIISAAGNVVISNEGGTNHQKRIYRIIPMENTITIVDFNSNKDILDLVLFPSFRAFIDLPYRSRPVTFFLSEKQRIILANHEEVEEMDLSDENFYFLQISSQHSDEGKGSSVRVDSTLIISLAILAVCAVTVMTFVGCLPSDRFDEGKYKNYNEDELSPSSQLEEGRLIATSEEQIENEDENNDWSSGLLSSKEEEEGDDEEDDSLLNFLYSDDFDSVLDVVNENGEQEDWDRFENGHEITSQYENEENREEDHDEEKEKSHLSFLLSHGQINDGYDSCFIGDELSREAGHYHPVPLNQNQFSLRPIHTYHYQSYDDNNYVLDNSIVPVNNNCNNYYNTTFNCQAFPDIYNNNKEYCYDYQDYDNNYNFPDITE
jgi:hypothetical protein